MDTSFARENDLDPPVEVVHDGNVTRLTLNRPDKLNAVNAALVEGALVGLREAVDRGARLVVFSGAGRAFSAGFDLSNLDAQSDGDLLFRFVRIETLLQEIHTAPLTTLALAHGRCFGAAADIFCACARRFAAPGTTFRMPGLKFGIVLGTRRLAHLVGTDQARDILAASRVFDVEEGRKIGFVQHCVAEETWPEVIDEVCEEAERLSPEAQRQLMQNSRHDSGDQEMAALVRSAAEPGLGDRIRAFVAASQQKK